MAHQYAASPQLKITALNTYFPNLKREILETKYYKYSTKNKMNRISLVVEGDQKRYKITEHLEIWLFKIIIADPFNSPIINFIAALFHKNKLGRGKNILTSFYFP